MGAKKTPQLENGYTKIANEILEVLVGSGLNGTEIACVLFVIRKTYGFNKKEDQLGIQQFLDNIPVVKQTIITALNRLKLVKILVLVQKGTCKKACAVYRFNKNYDEWRLVRKTVLVQKYRKTGTVLQKKLVTKSVPNKRNSYKRNYTKEMAVFFSYREGTQAWGDEKVIYLTPAEFQALCQKYGRRNIEKAIVDIENWKKLNSRNLGRWENDKAGMAGWMKRKKDDGKLFIKWSDFKEDDFPTQDDYLKAITPYV